MTEFLEMGGYARYLWPSFGLYLALLIWLGASALGHHRRALRDITAASTAKGPSS